MNNWSNLSLRNKNKINSKFTVPVGQYSGVMLMIFGGVGVTGLGIAIFVMTLLSFMFKSLIYVMAIVLMPLFVISMITFMAGNKIRKRLGRFKLYITSMKGKSYCQISDLSTATGLSNRFIEKDLRKMITSGMFPQGHIDDQKTWFMLNNKSYEHYLESQKQHLITQALEVEKAKLENHNLNPETKKSINTGRQLVLEIKEANVALPGEKISRKLNRLEEVTGKIFEYVEIHPEKLPEIEKFTDYFLPTTLKLVEGYKKLEYQSVQGNNISTAKAEIEESLDTITLAFENLLDDLFQDMAMDISTDISVLEIMLAQEGLTKDKMTINNKMMEGKNE